MDIKWTAHAEFEAKRRRVNTGLVEAIAEAPQQQIKIDKRLICQSRYEDQELGKEMLLRVVVEKSEIIKIITVYKTSQIERYWLK